MKTNRLVLTSLGLLFWMLPVDLKQISVISDLEENAMQPLPLSMSEDSIDDMYSTCNKTMTDIVNIKYFNAEIKSEPFKGVWKHAEKCANRAQPKDIDEELTKNHLQAICAYTAGANGLYKIFNNAVRTQQKGYGSTFKFHFLHFWLTRAVQILNNNQKCHETYRRTTVEFNGRVKDEIRFGTFTSTSKLSNLTSFGDVTCFKVKTCFGAFLKEYPMLRSREQEVLIPPYEKFRITKKCETEECKKAENLIDCKVVFVLKSAGVQSNLDCQIAKRKIKSYFNPHISLRKGQEFREFPTVPAQWRLKL